MAWLCDIKSAFDCSSCVLLRTHLNTLLTTLLGGEEGVDLLASLYKHVQLGL